MALPDLIAVDELMAPPERAAATISPDGTRLAFLAPWKNRLNVWVQDLEGTAEPRCVTADETRTVQRYLWTDDPRWLLYLQDTNGDENWHVLRVDLDDPEAPAVDLTPFPGATTLPPEQLVDRPGKLLLQLNARDVAEFDLHELDIATGELTMLAESPGGAGAWMAAGDQLYLSTTADNGDLLVFRPGSDIPLVAFDGAAYPVGVYPMEVTPDGTGLWFGSYRGTDHLHLARLDLTTGQETLVDSQPGCDIDTLPQAFNAMSSPLIRHPRTGELLGVRYHGERQWLRALDPEFAQVLARLRELSDGDLATLSCDRELRRWVVSFVHDRDPGLTWFYDHATGERRLLFRPRPQADPDAMAPMLPVTIPARDGLSMPSYLTLPVGVEPEGLPLVLAVHGGPWSRDWWGYNPMVQLLANRGYAVLQPNFRGSAGFGRAHMEAAVGEFAGAMHDDLIDAVEWAVAQGYADPERVAIFGGSYGGYAALVGVTFTPDRFAAAVEYVGISDLANFMRTVPEFARSALTNNWYRYVGDPADPRQEADMLARSPISRIDAIRTPLLVAQGANDVRVVRAESDAIVEGLRARGVEVEYLVFDDEGHFFVNPENLVTLMRSVDRFLAAHLGGRAG